MSERAGGFCTECGHEVESFDGLDRCPACGTSGVPCAWADQVSIDINWHELRILVIWAENWARHIRRETPGLSKTVYAIARRIAGQHAGRTPLTLAGELGQIAARYDMSVNDPELRRDIAEQTGRETGLLKRRDEDEEPPSAGGGS